MLNTVTKSLAAGWESLVELFDVQGLAHELGTCRKLKLKMYYDKYLAEFKPVQNKASGKVTLIKQPTIDYVRCVCGHAHRW